ncbi:hypothetical protein ACFIOY_29025 [Bradyrhizobium sp. TZ2]
MSNQHQNTHLQWPNGGFVRLNSILSPKGPLPISRSSWWAGVASTLSETGKARSAYHRLALRDLLKLMGEA